MDLLEISEILIKHCKVKGAGDNNNSSFPPFYRTIYSLLMQGRVFFLEIMNYKTTKQVSGSCREKCNTELWNQTMTYQICFLMKMEKRLFVSL